MFSMFFIYLQKGFVLTSSKYIRILLLFLFCFYYFLSQHTYILIYVCIHICITLVYLVFSVYI